MELLNNTYFPDFGFSINPIIFKSEVLPEPDGPIIPIFFGSLILKSKFLKILTGMLPWKYFCSISNNLNKSVPFD